jgi:hypothetical protein
LNFLGLALVPEVGSAEVDVVDEEEDDDGVMVDEPAWLRSIVSVYGNDETPGAGSPDGSKVGRGSAAWIPWWAIGGKAGEAGNGSVTVSGKSEVC